MWIMGLHDEFTEASGWVRDEFRPSLESSTADVNLFEATIRVLGGLLSAYHFSADDLFISKALDIGEVNKTVEIKEKKKIYPSITVICFSSGDIGSNSIKPIYFSKQTNARQRAVVDAFRHAWSAYKKYAWGQDMLKPLSKSAHKWFGLGLTIVDSLDTMWIMGLHDEFAEASGWVRDEFRPSLESSTADVNLFEATIRVLGGLLSAYHFSADDLFISKALDIGEVNKTVEIKGAFRLPSFGVIAPGPYRGFFRGDSKQWMLHIFGVWPTRWSPDSSTAEVTTLQLEFRDLSRVTKLKKFEFQNSKGADLYVHTNDAHYLLRPEFLESLFVMYQLTGNTTYQEWGWKIFQEQTSMFTQTMHIIC
ncbi:endoplasmic reticulum mannosyl-oligosaccharide 1,2-alpha-mannosidase-like [Diaphorina citri]|uniref:alpha-1,2-Mannosidase n=1 Tax=Diaphorina citri TaxID=121845 RepID=A0A3Q0JHM0_DIACI|nr:endoplasmic reticulum mannosyl-oligosaccharide 1,2-alpha-mannosidase-like [Diaphorina citri]